MQSKSKPVPYRLNFAIDSWQEWGVDITTRPTVINELGGGKTNESWLLESEGRRFVVRLNNPISGLLGIDRKRERVIHSVVAKHGIAPAYLYMHAPSDASVFQWVEGTCLTASDLAKPSYRTQLLDLVDRYQKLEVDLPRFNYHYYITRYWQKVEMVKPVFARGHREGWEAFLERFNAFDRRSWRPVVTHHDLEPSNILMTQKGIKIIDWEYSGYGHPSFDPLYLHRSSECCPEILTELIHWLSVLWSALYEYGHGR